MVYGINMRSLQDISEMYYLTTKDLKQWKSMRKKKMTKETA